jgi:hypothetical protein
VGALLCFASRRPVRSAVRSQVGGYIQAREIYQSPIGLTATLNRARSSVDGSLPGGFSCRILAEYEASGTATTAASVSLRDAYIRWGSSAQVSLARAREEVGIAFPTTTARGTV